MNNVKYLRHAFCAMVLLGMVKETSSMGLGEPEDEKVVTEKEVFDWWSISEEYVPEKERREVLKKWFKGDLDREFLDSGWDIVRAERLEQRQSTGNSREQEAIQRRDEKYRRDENLVDKHLLNRWDVLDLYPDNGLEEKEMYDLWYASEHFVKDRNRKALLGAFYNDKLSRCEIAYHWSFLHKLRCSRTLNLQLMNRIPSELEKDRKDKKIVDKYHLDDEDMQYHLGDKDKQDGKLQLLRDLDIT